MTITFTKYHGLGNDFILIDNRHQSEPLITPEKPAEQRIAILVLVLMA